MSSLFSKVMSDRVVEQITPLYSPLHIGYQHLLECIFQLITYLRLRRQNQRLTLY